MRKYKVICPLFNFQIPNVLIRTPELSSEGVCQLLREREKELVEGIELFDGVKIRRISKEDLEDLKSSFPPPPPDTVVSPDMFVLEKYITTEEDHNFQLDRTMQNIVLAMRLLKEGYVSGNAIFYILVSEKPEKRPWTLIDWSWDEGRRLESWGFRYALKFEEIPALKKIVEKIQSIDFAKRKSLHIACKRFQRAYEEVDLEDQLIDLMISFEALFLKGKKVGVSIGQTIAIACSTLLGRNDEEREEIRRFLTKAYVIRNCIVHGSEYQEPIVCKDKEYSMSEFVSKIDEYLRESINKLLD